MDFPFYFGNTLAMDFLRLTDNEWQDSNDLALGQDYSILSVGSGDLRNLVYTIASLPNEFRGKIHITMCDFDPFVMARNVLLLYIMVAEADQLDIEKKLTTIWYSLQFTKAEHQIITKALKKLCCCSTGSDLHEMTGGMIKMSDKEVKVLLQVWKGWRDRRYITDDKTEPDPDDDKVWKGFKVMDCDKSGSVLWRQRAKAVKNVRLRGDHHIFHRPSNNMWMRSGKFTAQGRKPSDLTHDNVTLTGRMGYDFARRYEGDETVDPYQQCVLNEHEEEHSYERYEQVMLEDPRQPKDSPFKYCLQGDVSPYRVWDYAEVRAVSYNNDLEIMYFEYIRNCINLTIEFIREKRLSVKATITEGRKLHLNETECFDRIFTSNLLDYFGMHPLVRKFGPHLRRSNPHAVLVMETIYWIETVCIFNEGEMKGQVKLHKRDLYNGDVKNLKMQCRLDIFCNGGRLPEEAPMYNPIIDDYDFDAGNVIKHLKADYMASEKIGDAKAVPSTKQIMECGELRMRDVRRERNKVAPFRDIYHGRQGGIPWIERRMVEWYYPE